MRREQREVVRVGLCSCDEHLCLAATSNWVNSSTRTRIFHSPNSRALSLPSPNVSRSCFPCGCAVVCRDVRRVCAAGGDARALRPITRELRLGAAICQGHR
eukprot:4642988-Pleurochrysis_carterae.AAC.2